MKLEICGHFSIRPGISDIMNVKDMVKFHLREHVIAFKILISNFLK